MLRANGRRLIVQCRQDVLRDPPQLGAVITVKHNGYYENGTIKFPFFYRERKDITWDDLTHPKRIDRLDAKYDWSHLHNQKAFFDRLGDSLRIKSLDGWYAVTVDKIEEGGGRNLVRKLYGGSIFKALRMIYPKHDWKPWLFQQSVSRGYWESKENQLEYMRWLGGLLKIDKMEDWYCITRSDILNNYGGSALHKHSGSLPKLIQSVFADHNWDQAKWERRDSKDL